MLYFVKTPGWMKKVYPSRVWDFPGKHKQLYLSFDDGPHPLHTPQVLDILQEFTAKATFFCIGKNVMEHPVVYRRIIEEGHAVGNHTHNHLNGWKVDDGIYLDNVHQAKQFIDTDLFRPPYGRASTFQVRQLMQPKYRLKTIMWSVLSGDFDTKLSPEECLQNVLLNARDGSIIVFHDSEKAQERMLFALPAVLKYFTERGFSFEKIPRQLT